MTSYARPKFAQLLDWLEGRLPEAEAQALSAALEKAGVETQADLAWLRSFLEVSKKIKLSTPPPGVRKNLKRLFSEKSQDRRPAGFFQRLQASLFYDSQTQPAAAGLRSVAREGQHRQLIFNTGVAEVALDVYVRPEDGLVDLAGQVFPTEESAGFPFSIYLMRGSNYAGRTSADELGEFFFTGLGSGDYEMILSTERFEIVLPTLKL
jgi:hypothetical protein